MNKEFKIQGYFWLPADDIKKINQVQGTLNYSFAEGIVLELMGSFKNDARIKEVTEYDIIHGISNDGKKITMLNAFIRNRKQHFPGIEQVRIIANGLYIGHLFNSIADIHFKEISFSCTYLHEWVGKSGFAFERNSQEKEVSIKYKLPEQIKANLENDYILKISFSLIGPTHTIYQEEATIKQRTEIIIESKEGEKNMQDYSKLTFHLRNLLCLATLKPVHFLHLTGFTESCKTELMDDMNYSEPIEIYFNQSKSSGVSKNLTPFDLLFSLHDLSDNFEKYLSEWFCNFELYEPVYDLFFESRFYSNLNWKNKFLNLARVIEAFHRRRYEGSYMNRDEFMEKIYPALVQAIPPDIESDFQESIKSTLKFVNEYSLRRRLKNIFKKDDKFIASFFNNSDKLTDKLISKIVEIRNQLTHYDEKTTHKTVETEVYKSCLCLELVLIVLFLQKIGFENASIRKMIENSGRLRHIMNNWAP